MIIMGIETSCDDTSVSIMKDGKVLSVSVHTQLEHIEHGGVIPEIASRAHVKNIPLVMKKALKDAGKELADIECIGVTYGPGLVGPLLVGVNFAKGLSYSLGVPLVPVNHIEAHIAANYIEHPDIEPPFIVLVVSGGHTELVRTGEDHVHRIISKTRDDAAGECIDKVSKMLGLGFPGGRIIDELAAKGDRHFEKFPRAMKNSLDFSFSGLKTALKYYIEKHDEDYIKKNINNIAASFLDAVTDSLTGKLGAALKEHRAGTVLLAGGVSANSMLRQKAADLAKRKKVRLCYPSPVYCTDNAAMVASAARLRIEREGIESFPFDAALDAVPFLTLD